MCLFHPTSLSLPFLTSTSSVVRLLGLISFQLVTHSSFMGSAHLFYKKGTYSIPIRQYSARGHRYSNVYRLDNRKFILFMFNMKLLSLYCHVAKHDLRQYFTLPANQVILPMNSVSYLANLPKSGKFPTPCGEIFFLSQKRLVLT